jgi:hypothetical protein
MQPVIHFHDYIFLVAQIGHLYPCAKCKRIVCCGQFLTVVNFPVRGFPPVEFVGIKAGRAILRVFGFLGFLMLRG